MIKESVVFARLIEEHGALEKEAGADPAGSRMKAGIAVDDVDKPDHGKEQAELMQAEERYTGAVSWETYAKYLRLAGGIAWVPFILGLLTVTEMASGWFLTLVS